MDLKDIMNDPKAHEDLSLRPGDVLIIPDQSVREGQQAALRRPLIVFRLGVIGYGYWGPNVVRNFAMQPNCQRHHHL